MPNEKDAGKLLTHLTDPIEPPTDHYQDPTPEMLNDPIWNAIWNEIKRWDINVPSQYRGYMGATGNHATAIYLAVREKIMARAGEAVKDVLAKAGVK